MQIEEYDKDEQGRLNCEKKVRARKGKGDAVNLKIKMTLAEDNPQLHFKNRSLRHLKSGESLSVDVLLHATPDMKTRQNDLRIEITEENGFKIAWFSSIKVQHAIKQGVVALSSGKSLF